MQPTQELTQCTAMPETGERRRLHVWVYDDNTVMVGIVGRSTSLKAPLTVEQTDELRDYLNSNRRRADMLNASEAAAASKNSLENLTTELKSRMQEVINSAIKQGSCKATFYPRNAFESQNAMTILQEHGYDVKKHDSKDQRDHDRIDIQWG